MRLRIYCRVILLLAGLQSGYIRAETLSPALLYDVACSACHSLGSTTDHRVGPPLGDVKRRTAGAVKGYPYSQAVMESNHVWTLPTLVAWLTDPEAMIPNNAMNYSNALTAEETLRLAEWLLEQSGD